MKLQLQGLSFAWAPSKVQGGVLAMPLKRPKFLQLIYERNDKGFLKFDNNPKHLHDFANTKLWSLKKCFWTINNKKRISINHGKGKTVLRLYPLYRK